MAELKRNFSQAKMNKDMDERVLSPGQYRDAKNVQISTSDGANVGSVQSLLGNTEVTSNVVPVGFCKTVGAIAVPEKDLIYYLVAGSGNPVGTNQVPDIQKDYILEFDTVRQTTKYVFVDIHRVKTTVMTTNHGAGQNWIDVSDGGYSTNKTGIRTGMQITAVIQGSSGGFTNSSGSAFLYTKTDQLIANTSRFSVNINHQIFVTDVVKIANGWRIYHDYQWQNGATNFPVTAGDSFSLAPEGGQIAGRVLQLDPLIKINAINYLDGMLFWTDGATEPKKIHVGRSKAGTGGTKISAGWDDAQKTSHINNTSISSIVAGSTFAADNADFHTRLVITDPSTGALKLALNVDGIRRTDVAREHITVIKKSPKFPLDVKMFTTEADRVPVNSNNPNKTNSTVADASNGYVALQVDFVDSGGTPLPIGTSVSLSFTDEVDFRRGDHIVLTSDPSGSAANWDDDLIEVTLLCTSSSANVNSPVKGPYSFTVVIVDSTVANVPQFWHAKLRSPDALFQFKFPRFSYRWKFEDGEFSTFAPWSDVAFLPTDFNYQAKEGYNTGMVNNVRSINLTKYFHEPALVPRDVVGVELLYKEDGKPTVYSIKYLSEKDKDPEWPDRTNNKNRGQFKITTEMIHAVVPSNQILRPWDNVPKAALAQEISANRLIYANYKQNYDITDQIKLDVSIDHTDGRASGPLTSVKTLRNYQVGIVFSDEYGRETPVLVPKEDSTVSLSKEWSTSKNRLNARLSPVAYNAIPSWAQYLRYYVKETSNEYYNLTQDRWYNAEDGNIWLSFPSAERNKIDEDTFLILKNEHDADKAVFDDTRYKVIAIEDDAPLFIKTTMKPHGGANTDLQTGASLAATKTFEVANATFKNGFGNDFITETLPKIASSNLYGRIVGTNGTTTLTTEWIGVTKVYTKSGASEIVVQIDQKLATADMDASLSGSITYSVELRENVVQNKPEFDGRFFVKVLKDSFLQEYIMKIDPTSQEFIVVDTFDFRSILPPGQGSNGTGGDWHSNSYSHPSVTTPTAGTHTHNTGNYDWVGAGANDFDDDHKFGYCGGLTETRDFWQNYNKANVWFIDGAAYSNNNVNYQWGQGINDSQNGLHSSHPNGNASNARGIKLSVANKNAQIWWGCWGWGNDFNSVATAFKSKMTTVGTLFQFRGDPDNVTYKVTAHKSSKQIGNYVKNTFRCKRCGSSEWGCKRSIFSITFERLDGALPGTVSGQANTGVIDYNYWDPLSLVKHDGKSSAKIDIVELDLGAIDNSTSLSTSEPAIWETEPKEDVGLDIYYEASGALPLKTTHKDNELLIPVGSRFKSRNYSGWHEEDTVNYSEFDGRYTVTAVNSTGNPDTTFISFYPRLIDTVPHDSYIELERYDGSTISLYVGKPASPISGTIDVTASTTVTGVNTKFLTEVHIGDTLIIRDSINNAIEKRTVTAIASNTSLTVAAAFSNLNIDNNPHIHNAYRNVKLEGTVDVTASTTVTGVGTNFTILNTGDRLVITDPNTGDVEVRKIASIASNTSLTVTQAFTDLANDLTPEAQVLRQLEIVTGNVPTNLQSGSSQPWRAPHHMPFKLGWHNCWRFGNGVESDRIRDDFNAPQVANGVKASTVLATPYAEEHKSSGLIFSGIYNSISGVNDLNQFIQAEPITKDLNPRHGSIQALVTRDTNTVVFCEDKVFSVLTNKDALFNADGNSNVTSNAAVLGQAMPMEGDYGISTNPESLAVTADSMYFSDAMRGQVLQLSGNSIIPISDIGMKDWFNDNLPLVSDAIGSYDDRKDEYNLTLNGAVPSANVWRKPHYNTISYNEKTKGWTCFKDFKGGEDDGLELGISLNSKYYTFYRGSMWEHHTKTVNNNFYNTQYDSGVTLIFNDEPSSVKSFGTLNYEGTTSRQTAFVSEDVNNTYIDPSTNAVTVINDMSDLRYRNLTTKTGWYVNSITTDLQEAEDLEFINKEGKWFTTVKGASTFFNSHTDNNLDEREFSVQGLGMGTVGSTGTPSAPYKLHVQPGTSNAANTVNWDSSADSTKWRIIQSATLNPTIHIQGTAVADGYRDVTIDNLQTNSSGVLVYSGFDIDAEMFEVPSPDASFVTTSGSGWTTTHIYTAHVGWNADTVFSSGNTVANSGGGIWKVEFTNIGIQGSTNTVRARIYFKGYTAMPAADQTFNVDIDAKPTVRIPPGAPPSNPLRQSSFRISFNP